MAVNNSGNTFIRCKQIGGRLNNEQAAVFAGIGPDDEVRISTL